AEPGPAAASAPAVPEKDTKGRRVKPKPLVRGAIPKTSEAPPWPAAKKPHAVQAAAAAHKRQSRRRLQRPNEDGASRALRLAHEIEAPVDTVGAVDIGVAGRPEHYRMPGGRPAVAMRGRIGVVIGLNFDQPAADTVEQQRRSDQVGRHLVNAAAKKRFGQWL